MKVGLYSSISANGFFIEAGAGYRTPPEVLADFMDHVKQHGNLIIGRKTYDMVVKASRLDAYKDVELVVVSSGTAPTPGAHKAASPEAALQYLQKKGFKHAVVGGGALLDSAMLTSGLVSELYINILPVITSEGVSISGAKGSAVGLNLLKSSELASGITQLHYNVSVSPNK